MKPAIFYFLRSLFGYPRLGEEQTQGVGDTTPSSPRWLKEEDDWVQLKDTDLLTTGEEERGEEAVSKIEQKKPGRGKKKKKKV